MKTTLKQLVCISIVAVCSVVAVSGVVCAADAPIQIGIDKRHVVLGDSCMFTIRSKKELPVPPQVPAVDGLSVQYAGAQKETTSHFQLVINGRNVQTDRGGGGIKYFYRIFPQKVGSFQFPSVEVSVGNKTYRTNPFTIEVVDQGEQSEHIFLVQEIDKKEAFIGEKIRYRFKWYFKKDIEGYECNVPWLSSLDNFIVQDPEVDQSKHYQRLVINGSEEVYAEKKSEILNGQRYAVVTFDKILIPLKTGAYELGSSFLRCDVVKAYARPQRRSFFDDFFQSDFDSFFGIGRQAITEPFITRADPIAIEVKKIPEDNKPETFSNGIGQFVFKATVSPLTVKEGEPITISMYVGGTGNVEHVIVPEIPEMEGFRGYDPESSLDTKEVDGKEIVVKAFKKVVIPTIEGVYEMPRIEFSYFDTVTRQYETLSQGPFSITVEKGAAEEAPVRLISMDDMLDSRKKITVVRHDIHFIKTQLGDVYRRSEPVYKNVPFLLTVGGVPFGLWCVLWVYNRKRMRLKTDIPWARKKAALKKALRALQGCARSDAEGAEWYFALGKIVSDFVVEKCSLSATSLTPDMVHDLASAGVSAESRRALATVFDKLDGARFGMVHDSADEKAAFVSQIKELVCHIDKEVT